MTYYCRLCRRVTDAYDLWPNGECMTCYCAFENVMDSDAIYNPVFAS